MRQGHNKRMRGRNRKGPNPLSRSFESNGPDVKIRGTASHIAEKYVTLARDAASSGDRVAEQNYLQHAEHYFRIVAAAQAQMPQPQPQQNNQRVDEGDGDQSDASPNGNQPPAGASDAQPRANGADGSGEANGHAGNGEMNAAQDGNAGNGDGRGRQRRQSSQESGTASNANISVDEDSAPTSSDD